MLFKKPKKAENEPTNVNENEIQNNIEIENNEVVVEQETKDVVATQENNDVQTPIEVVEEDIKVVEEEKVEETPTPAAPVIDNKVFELQELQAQYDLLDEKNKNLARILKEISVELKEAREESERQFEVIGKLASEKQALEQKLTESTVKNKKLELDVEVRDDQLSEFKKLGGEADTIQNQIINYKETAKTIAEELENKNNKLRDLQSQVKNLEQEKTQLEETLNKVKDEKDDLAIVVLQQQRKIENKEVFEVLPEGVTESNIDYKELDKSLRSEVEELSENVKTKDRLIVRQVGQINDLNEKINKKDDEISAQQDQINDLVNRLNKNALEKSITNNFIKPTSNGSLLGRVMENELDLKLKNVVNYSKETLASDEEISKLLDKIESCIINAKTDMQYVKQYQFELFEGIQQAVIDFINSNIQKEATAYDYIVALNNFEDEKEKLELSYNNQITTLNNKLKNSENEVNKLKIALYRDSNYVDDNKTIGEYREENKRLNQKIDALNKENDILINDKNDSVVNELASLFANERESNRETEKLLKAEISTLKEKLNDATKRLEKLNGEYFLSEVENNLKRIDDIITKVENGEVNLSSGLLDAYYKEAYDRYSKQMLIYHDEITKRDELLKGLLDDKSEEQGLMVERDINGELGDDEETREKIKHNEQMIDAIEDIFNTKIVKLDLENKKSLDARILKEFKAKIKEIFDNMIININQNAKVFTEELTNNNALNALELYNNDFNKMAKYYVDEIGSAALERDLTTNEFAKILGNAKVAALSNEFACLVRFKEEKSQEKFNGIYKEKGEYTEKINENFSGTLEDISEVREELNTKLHDLSANFDTDMAALTSEIEKTRKTIEDLNNQMNEATEDNQFSIRVDIESKTKVLNYLENDKRNELTEDYFKQIKDIKLQIEALDKMENQSKEDYIDRSKNESLVNKDMNDLSMEINNAYGIKNINTYLQSLNNIEYSYFETINSENESFNQKINALEEKFEKLNGKITYYRNLILLKNDYLRAINVMRTDYKQVRNYDSAVCEATYLAKQIEFYTKEIEKAKEKITCGVDEKNSKDSVVMFQAKLMNYKDLLEAKNVEIDEMKDFHIVAQYINALDKVAKIEEIIKEKGKEFA